MIAVERIAIIDMGSNSFRLVVYGYERGRHWQHVDEIREPVRISAGMGDDQLLRPDLIDRAVRTSALFAAFCRAEGIDQIVTVATSAIRAAANRDLLLEALRASSGLDVRVISEHEEARYGFLAIANSTTLEDGFGFDVGGGSVQAMQIADRRLRASGSWPLGAVRMSERFLPDQKASGKALKALRKHVEREVASAPWFEPGSGLRAVGIGGTLRNLAAAAEKRAGLPFTEAQGFSLTRDALEAVIGDLAALPASKRSAVPGIKPDRGDVILGGAAVLAALMDRAGLAAVEVTSAGLREGIFFERFLAPLDPPLFERVRRASVENLAHRYEQDLGHAAHVAALSLQMFDGLGELGIIAPDPAGRELLWAACMLHDIGTAVDYDDHHKHSRYLILNAGLPGFTPREVELIALIARYHRKGEPDPSELGALEQKGDTRTLNVLSGIIRLAEQLERSRDQAVASVRLSASADRLMVVPESGVDASVAVWSARRSADLLERAIDHPVDIIG
ncbi:MAG: Ppx/GppA phosphatase family protein [Thermoleophilaceae bacterium]